MSIFTRKTEQVVTENSVGISEEFMEPTSSGLQAILFESSRDALKLQSAMYIADVVMEQQVTLEGANPDIVMEGFAGDAMNKVKKLFVTLWEKVKGWFAKVKRLFQILFTSGTDFIKKFKNELREKSVKGFKYDGYKWTIESGVTALNGKVKIINDYIGDKVDFSLDESHMSSEGQEASIRAKNPDAENHKTDETKEALLEKLGSKETSEILETLAKEFRGKQSEKDDFEDFSANSKEEMISWLEKGNDHLREIEKQEKDINAQFNRVLTSVNKAKSAIEKSENPTEGSARGRLAAFATHKYNLAHYALTVRNQLVTVHTQAVKDCSKSFEATLKSFLHYKPVKDSFVPEVSGSKNNGEQSLLESVSRYL